MSLPIRTVVRPAVLGDQLNGKLPDTILVDTPGQAGGPTVRLVAPAARAWRALCAAALSAGHVLKATSTADSYRTYEVQERVFRERYTTTFIGSAPVRIWNGVRWYQRAGVAPAAVPGTSNHGWGLAVDTGEERDGDTGTETMDADTLAWLVGNEGRFGFSHELEPEPWHIRYWAGDAIPQAVLDYEKGPLMALSDGDQERLAWRVSALLKNQPAVTGGPSKGEPNELHTALAAIGDRLAKLEQALSAPLATTASGQVTFTPVATGGTVSAAPVVGG